MIPPTVVVGGQAGSEGKGMVCGELIRKESYDIAVRVGGPNAGHTVYDEAGRKYPLRQLPVAAVADHDCQLVIAAGSEVDLEVLKAEIELLEDNGHPVRERLLIDREATVLVPDHVKVESSIKTGTTGKGIGAARAARALREAPRVEDLKVGVSAIDTQELLRERIREGDEVFIEGTQGYVLGSHAGWYPYCTSGDCRAIDFLAACGLPPMEVKTWLVLRSYPIRIAGDSGPLRMETTWAEIGVREEITTVTKKVRRVGRWDWDWAKASVDAHRIHEGPELAITFCDYWWPELAGVSGHAVTLDEKVYDQLADIEIRLDARVSALGTGPNTVIWR